MIKCFYSGEVHFLFSVQITQAPLWIVMTEINLNNPSFVEVCATGKTISEEGKRGRVL